MKAKSISFLSSLGLLLGAAHAQTAAPDSKETVKLDTFVVTGAGVPKTVFDLAQGASVLAGPALRDKEAASLGETLADTPGVNSTYYGPGASRPIIRGLGGDRVRMLDNGVGSLDASNISPDHNVALEPLLVDRIEVLRGPATLLYGSSGVGGVVNVIDNRIPTSASDSAMYGRAEARYDSATKERAGVVLAGGGNRQFGLQVEGLRLISDDVKIPGVGQIGPDAPSDQPVGVLPSSAISTKNAAVGGSYFFSDGFVGLAASEYDTTYGVPTGDDLPTSIAMRQQRLDLRGEANRSMGIFKTIRVRLGLADYTHSELSGGTHVNTTFFNKAYEGRVELVQESQGGLSGTIGAQVARSDFSAVGEEVVTPPSVTDSQAVFALEEYKMNDALTLQLGGRVERQTIRLGEVDPDLPAVPGFAAFSGEKRTENGVSLSTGAVWYPVKDYSVGFSVAYSQRLPVAQELFSNGPHGGTGAYEVGTSGLGKEKSLGVDLTVRRRVGEITGSIGVFANRFDGFIFEQRLADDAIPESSNEDGLTPYQFVAKDALFYGGEAELTAHLVDTSTDRVHLELMSDYVRAEQTTDHEPLPRIPPFRAGAGLTWEHGPWTFGVNARHVFRQDRVAPLETETGGYTLVGANAGYTLVYQKVTYEFFTRGTNLTDQEARVHTSFLKDFAPLPGRSVTVGVRAAF